MTRKTVPVTKGEALHEDDQSSNGGDLIDEDTKSNELDDKYESGDEMFNRHLQLKFSQQQNKS